MKHWTHTPATKQVCPLWAWGDFVVSGHANRFCLRLRPPGQHIFIGDYATLSAAQNAAKSVDLTSVTDDGKFNFL